MRDEIEKYRSYVPDRRTALLLGILAAAAFLRFKYAFFEGLWIDEGRYGRIAASISEHPWNYSTTSELFGQITGHPPVFSYLIAFSMILFGTGEFAMRIVSPVVSLAAILLIYVFGREVRDRETGLIAAALLSVNPIFWFLSERVLIGATLTFMYTATMLAFWYGLEDRKYSKYAIWAVGPLTVLTILTKQPGYALGLILPIYFVYRKREAFIEAWKQRKLKDTQLYSLLTDRDYYISGGLAAVLFLPWYLRNTAVCGFPLCSFKRALSFAGRDITNPAVQHIQGLYFFVQSLPMMITLPVAAFILAGTGFSLLKKCREDGRTTFYLVAAYLIGLTSVFVLMEKLVPMALLGGLALFARKDFEKLCWIWAGIGIGFMSIPATKDPRYIVFTMPALVLLASNYIRGLSIWVSDRFGRTELKTFVATLILVAPALYMGYSQGIGDVKRGGYAELEPAGEFMSSAAPGGSNVAATSNGQMWYYMYPKMAYMPPENRSEFREFILEKNISYVEVDVYEPMQPEWTQTDIPPYRIPNSVREKLRSGEISQREVMEMFEPTPDYLTPVQNYGETGSPITPENQPRVIVYQVNRTALQ